MPIDAKEREELAREIREAAAGPIHAAHRQNLHRIAQLVSEGDIHEAAAAVETLYAIIRGASLARPFNRILLAVGRPRGIYQRWLGMDEG